MSRRTTTALMVLFSFTGLVALAEMPALAPQGPVDRTVAQGQSHKADAFAPRAMGRSAKPDAGETVKRPIWPWLLAGAVVLGVAAYFLFIKPAQSDDDGSGEELKRDVTVQSTPAAAAVFLDGQATGLSTNCVLKGVTSGTHTIRLEKDGYRDYETAIEVPSNLKQPASLNVALERVAITVSSPASGAVQETGQVLPIRWSVDFQALAAASPGAGALSLPNVKIELWRNGAKAADIAASAPNSGSYDWTVPAGQATGEGFSVRIVCPSDAAIFGAGPAFTIAARMTKRYESTIPAGGAYNWTCSFDSPIDVPEEGRIVAFSYRMSCYNETGVEIRMISPDGTKIQNPSYEYKDFVPTSVFNGHGMKGVWKLEVRDDKTPPERDDVTIWGGWALEITYLTWNGI